jgi:TRAP-type mannitol/chloroaromatic compound transport system substrate-binding protein
MTYVKQLREYEDAVMAKRLEEMTDEEVQRMVDDADSQKPPLQPQQRS